MQIQKKKLKTVKLEQIKWIQVWKTAGKMKLNSQWIILKGKCSRWLHKDYSKDWTSIRTEPTRGWGAGGVKRRNTGERNEWKNTRNSGRLAGETLGAGPGWWRRRSAGVEGKPGRHNASKVKIYTDFSQSRYTMTLQYCERSVSVMSNINYVPVATATRRYRIIRQVRIKTCLFFCCLFWCWAVTLRSVNTDCFKDVFAAGDCGWLSLFLLQTSCCHQFNNHVYYQLS